MKARLAKGPDWDMTSAWLAGGKMWKSSSLKRACAVAEALCCHPLANGPSAIAGGGAGAWFGQKLWQPMWGVPILLRLSFALRPLRLGAPEWLRSGC